MVLTFLNKHRHTSLLVLRIGIGCMFLFHGAPKLFGGAEKWAQVGVAMESFLHRVHACVLGIHGSDFRVLWRCLSDLRHSLPTGGDC